jgi:hypothetical protein
MSAERTKPPILSPAQLERELQLLRVWADLIRRRADELATAYTAQATLPNGVRALIPSVAADQPLPLARYPQAILAELMIAEGAYAQALISAEAAIGAARRASDERYTLIWHAHQVNDEPASGAAEPPCPDAPGSAYAEHPRRRATHT